MEKRKTKQSGENKWNNYTEGNIIKLTVALLIATIFVVAFNAYQLSQLTNFVKGSGNLDGIGTGGASFAGSDVIPRGVPPIYGKELGVSFDDVTPDDSQMADAAIRKLGVLDERIQLTGADLDRYVKIAGAISCEYCCGADSIIFTKEYIDALNQQIEAAISAGKISSAEASKYRKKAGDAACGCAHSFAMRGLAKYLIKNHGKEYTDDQILEELGKWKTLFFPGQITAKAGILKARGIELNYINLASNKYRGIEKGNSGQSGGMVGGC